MKVFPFINQAQSLLLLRISVALVFLAHATVRIANGTIPQFAGFLEDKGFPAGTVLVWIITIFELVGSILLIAGKFTKWLSLGFIVLLLIGIIIIHASLGWFVGEHGTGGVEYSFILIMALITIAASSKKPA